MIRSVLVANRGEIAVRVIRTLRALGRRAIATYSDADADALHVSVADEAVRLGPAPAIDSYLNVDRILDAVAASGADAVHPGYGFLAENAAFARRLTGEGVVWIGPPPSAIEAMGDKISAKALVAAAGVPVVPGTTATGLSDAQLSAAAAEIGLPVLLKPSAGGGGKGMHRVDDAGELAASIGAARREARASFGDDTLLVERWITRPRHIEVQVLADRHGQVAHLGERECSLQRRHQKIIEEAPSPLLDAGIRARIGASAVEAARAVGYVGAGTVEFIVSADRPDEYFFIEMNTRLQVEHPVTEAVTGLDLVEWQVRVAEGEPLGFRTGDIPLRGHAVEARIYAEDPDHGFLPSAGTLLALHQPERPHVRVDSGVRAGSVVGTTYDPLLAKVIAWGDDRMTSLARLDGALADTDILGVATNIGLLRSLLADPEVAAGRLDTGLVERLLDAVAPPPVPDDVLIAAGLHATAALQPKGPVLDPWEIPSGWRVGEHAETVWSWRVTDQVHEVGVRGMASSATVRVDGGQPVTAVARLADEHLIVRADGVTRRYCWAVAGEDLWLSRDGRSWRCRRHHPELSAAAGAVGRGGPATSPMPGTVTAISVAIGDPVLSGQTLVVVEAMKMEHQVRAVVEGTVTAVLVHVGQQVALDQALAVVSAADEAAGP